MTAIRTMHIPTTIATIALSVCLFACAGTNPGPTSVSYAVTAKENFQQGSEHLEKKHWIAAAKFFAFVKARFPYTKYAVEADLGLAEAEFGALNYVEAIDAFKRFIKFHPTHARVTDGYAQFKIADSYYRLVPTDFWLLPPTYEKDPSATYDAKRELAIVIKKYPTSTYVTEANQKLLEVTTKIASHEWYVANFYWGRKRPMGTVIRLRKLLHEHKGSAYEADALWLLGQAYVAVGMPDRAKTPWAELAQRFPSHPQATAAKNGSLAN